MVYSDNPFPPSRSKSYENSRTHNIGASSLEYYLLNKTLWVCTNRLKNLSRRIFRLLFFLSVILYVGLFWGKIYDRGKFIFTYYILLCIFMPILNLFILNPPTLNQYRKQISDTENLLVRLGITVGLLLRVNFIVPRVTTFTIIVLSISVSLLLHLVQIKNQSGGQGRKAELSEFGSQIYQEIFDEYENKIIERLDILFEWLLNKVIVFGHLYSYSNQSGGQGRKSETSEFRIQRHQEVTFDEYTKDKIEQGEKVILGRVAVFSRLCLCRMMREPESRIVLTLNQNLFHYGTFSINQFTRRMVIAEILNICLDVMMSGIIEPENINIIPAVVGMDLDIIGTFTYIFETYVYKVLCHRMNVIRKSIIQWHIIRLLIFICPLLFIIGIESTQSVFYSYGVNQFKKRIVPAEIFDMLLPVIDICCIKMILRLLLGIGLIFGQISYIRESEMVKYFNNNDGTNYLIDNILFSPMIICLILFMIEFYSHRDDIVIIRGLLQKLDGYDISFNKYIVNKLFAQSFERAERPEGTRPVTLPAEQIFKQAPTPTELLTSTEFITAIQIVSIYENAITASIEKLTTIILSIISSINIFIAVLIVEILNGKIIFVKDFMCSWNRIIYWTQWMVTCISIFIFWCHKLQTISICTERTTEASLIQFVHSDERIDTSRDIVLIDKYNRRILYDLLIKIFSIDILVYVVLVYIIDGPAFGISNDQLTTEPTMNQLLGSIINFMSIVIFTLIVFGTFIMIYSQKLDRVRLGVQYSDFEEVQFLPLRILQDINIFECGTFNFKTQMVNKEEYNIAGYIFDEYLVDNITSKIRLELVICLSAVGTFVLQLFGIFIFQLIWYYLYDNYSADDVNYEGLKLLLIITVCSRRKVEQNLAQVEEEESPIIAIDIVTPSLLLSITQMMVTPVIETFTHIIPELATNGTVDTISETSDGTGLEMDETIQSIVAVNGTGLGSIYGVYQGSKSVDSMGILDKTKSKDVIVTCGGKKLELEPSGLATGDEIFMGCIVQLATSIEGESIPIAKGIKDFIFKVSLIVFVLGITFFIIGMVENQNFVANIRGEMIESEAELPPNYLLYDDRLCVAVAIVIVLILRTVFCGIVSRALIQLNFRVVPFNIYGTYDINLYLCNTTPLLNNGYCGLQQHNYQTPQSIPHIYHTQPPHTYIPTHSNKICTYNKYSILINIQLLTNNSLYAYIINNIITHTPHAIITITTIPTSSNNNGSVQYLQRRDGTIIFLGANSLTVINILYAILIVLTLQRMLCVMSSIILIGIVYEVVIQLIFGLIFVLVYEKVCGILLYGIHKILNRRKGEAEYCIVLFQISILILIPIILTRLDDTLKLISYISFRNGHECGIINKNKLRYGGKEMTKYLLQILLLSARIFMVQILCTIFGIEASVKDIYKYFCQLFHEKFIMREVRMYHMH